MASETYTYTFNGTESHPSTLITGALPQFIGAWSITVTLSAPAGAIYNFQYAFSESIGGTACWSDGISLLIGNQTTTSNWTVGNPPASWHCTDWSTFTFGMAGATNSPPAGMQVTVVVTGSFTPIGECQYGTENNPDASIYTTVTAITVDTVAAVLGLGPVGITAMDALIGSPLVAYSCASLPPTAPTFNSGDFVGQTGIVAPGSWGKLMDLFRVGVWHFYCQCVPAPAGQPAPIAPTPPNPGPPLTTPGPQPTLPCTGEDMCRVLNIVVRQINSISLNLQYDRITNIYNPAPAAGYSYVIGPGHPGLTDEGSFAVANRVGFLVQITQKPGDTQILPGATPYNWDMGWVGLENADGTLEERRLTRDSYVWLPAGAQRATLFSWFCRPGVGITVFELVAASP